MGTHAADADYSAQNLPDEDELIAMMESAVALAETLGGGRRRVDGEGRGLPRNTVHDSRAWEVPLRPMPPHDATSHVRLAWDPVVLSGMAPPPVVSIDDGFDPPSVAVHDPAVLPAALAKAAQEPPRVSAQQAQLLGTIIAEVRERVETVRWWEADDPILGHALNSIELGLIGLAKVAGGGGEGGDNG